MDTQSWIIIGVVGILIGLAVFFGMNMIRVETRGNVIVYTVDENGNPISGAKVVLKTSSGKVVGSGITDENGSIIFLDVELNVKYSVEAKTAELFGIKSIFPKRDGEEVIITLKKMGETSGGSDRPNL